VNAEDQRRACHSRIRDRIDGNSGTGSGRSERQQGLERDSSTVLGEDLKERLMQLNDRRISKSGIAVIKSQRFRNQDKNKEDALQRLADLIQKALVVQKARKRTRPSKKVREKRLEEKSRRARLKQSRRPVDE
jgi:ribosome-associated protein